jgi:hypothetical protein
MVTVVDYKQTTNADDEVFFMLIVQGGVESVVSQRTGQIYLTAKKAVVSSTFNEVTCKGLIGTKLPGGVERVEVDPYSIIDEESGEEVEFSHRYVYNPSMQSAEEAVIGNSERLERA